MNGIDDPNITKRVGIFSNLVINAGPLVVGEVINSAPLSRMLLQDQSDRVTLKMRLGQGGVGSRYPFQGNLLVEV